MTVQQLVEHIRQVVLEHPYAAKLPVVIHPHGMRPRQDVERVHLNLHETAFVIEAEA